MSDTKPSFYRVKDTGYVTAILVIVGLLFTRCTVLDVARIHAASSLCWDEELPQDELTEGRRAWM